MIRKAARSIAKRLGYRAETSRPLPPSPQTSGEFRALGDRVINKAGRMVLTGEFQGERVKIYEAANPTHAEFIEWVSNESELRDIFPAIRCRRGTLLYAEWVEGVPFSLIAEESRKHDPLDKLLELQLRLNQLALPNGTESGFNYLHDYILPRFERFAHLFEANDLVPQVRDQFSNTTADGLQCVQNPDVTHRNLIIDHNGALRLIDNDILTTGVFSLCGPCNTAYALPEEWRQPYWESYLHQSGISFTHAIATTLNAFWFARLLGSLSVANRFSQARTLVERFRYCKNVLPFSVS